MLNRKTASEAVDVPGYGHIIKNNLSHTPKSSGKHIIDVNQAECEIANNSFLPVDMAVTDDDLLVWMLPSLPYLVSQTEVFLM